MMEMVHNYLCLMFVLAIRKTASQNLTVTPSCITAGTKMKLTCETTDFASAVLFYLNGGTKGGCTTITCQTSIAGFETPIQSGTTTEMTITSYDHSRDGGDWRCTYGASTSSIYTVILGSCTSPDSPESNTLITIITVVVVGISLTAVIAVLMIYFKVYKRRGHQSESEKIPQEPRGPLKINNVDDHIIFEWESPKWDGGSKITEYIVEVQGNNFGTWERVGSSSKTKLKVPMYQYEDRGVMSFRVRAKNAVGFSNPLLAQGPFNLQNSYALLADRPVQGRGPAGQVSLLDGVPTDRKLPERE